jgi:hypothetical protein
VAACSNIRSGGVAAAVAACRRQLTETALPLRQKGWHLQLKLPRPRQSR